MEKITEQRVPVKRKTVRISRSWRDTYYCPDCGEVIRYRKSESDTHDVEA